ncbi:XrtA system polysaccharide deacetylase [Pseudothermotoga lettingae]|uniref:PEP-CTERM locus polysaccharide deactylase n=1 Tax=Pseudothermotoga lettingae (strain ATCC BAA-301 / DSM 14385 / NBRC 107922 / TMO) TaxID=416591 RepID=A8F6F1_PSELT|nr:XrtA system polysaccharide deacetylase [Pseudothermotoga lettingae]ABV33735.1 PEP-CTERM locus polysaccharide deactylase [Pseudothermotoga lettingae TMO]GLI49347.1 polysaccharide deacetylase [Pseudothermotoga lettingae TMO]
MAKTIYLSFDVEDWFQVENLREMFPLDSWEKCELRIEKNVEKILTLLGKYGVKATFFVLGWIAERQPDIVKEIYNDGHEIASHGYSHIINYNLSREEIFNDIEKSKKILEKIIGKAICGYRAPNFSITENVIDALVENGFLYDSSYHPFSKNSRYGKIENSDIKPFRLKKSLIEIPLSVYKKGKCELPIAGGGYFRLYPYSFYKALLKRYLMENDSLVLYFHPWEFDPEQPKVKNIKFLYRFRHYVGLSKTFEKLERILIYFLKENFTFGLFREITLE